MTRKEPTLDEQRFDTWTRAFAQSGSRRRLVRAFVGGGAVLAAVRRSLTDTSAQDGMSGPGDPCRTSDQCVAADAPMSCDWNGYGNGTNCCTYEGSNCADDTWCCGSNLCIGGTCTSQSSSCTGEGCDCLLYRDPGCLASCPLYDPCDQGLVCTGTSDVTGTCIDQNAAAGDPGGTDSGLNQTGSGFSPGQACISDSQCDNSFPDLGIAYCADTGLVYGDYGGTQHCCRYEGGSCGGPVSSDDSLCCGNLSCLGGVCGWG